MDILCRYGVLYNSWEWLIRCNGAGRRATPEVPGREVRERDKSVVDDGGVERHLQKCSAQCCSADSQQWEIFTFIRVQLGTPSDSWGNRNFLIFQGTEGTKRRRATTTIPCTTSIRCTRTITTRRCRQRPSKHHPPFRLAECRDSAGCSSSSSSRPSNRNCISSKVKTKSNVKSIRTIRINTVLKVMLRTCRQKCWIIVYRILKWICKVRDRRYVTTTTTLGRHPWDITLVRMLSVGTHRPKGILLFRGTI